MALSDPSQALRRAGSTPVFGDCADALTAGRLRSGAKSRRPRVQSDAVAEAWRIAGWGLGLGIAVLLAVFWQTGWSAVLTWYGSDTFGHCFLIFPAAGYLAWRRQALLLEAPPRATLWGVALLALAACAWLLGELTSTLVVQQFALVVMIQSLVWALLGHRATWILAFPLFFLFLAVPSGDFLIPPLQDFTAQFVVRALRLVEMPVYVDGWMIHIPSGSFHVAEACAGARFLISTVALALIAVDLLYRSIWRRLVFLALACVLPIVANGFRALGIVITAHLSDYTVAAGADHITYGLVFLSIVTLLLLAIGMTFRETDAEPLVGGWFGAMPAPEQAAALARRLAVVSVMVLVVTLGARGYAHTTEQRLAQSALPDLRLGMGQAGWQIAAQAGPNWQPDFPAADLTRQESYRLATQSVDLFVAYFTHQRQGFEVSNPTNRFADEDNWIRSGSGGLTTTLDGAPTVVRYERLKQGADRRLVWYWFWVDGRFTADPYLAKALEAKAKLLGGQNAAAVVAVSTPEPDGVAAASEVLRQFLNDFAPLSAVLDGNGERIAGPIETHSERTGDS